MKVITDSPTAFPCNSSSFDNYSNIVDELININNIKIISMRELTILKKVGEGGQSIVYEGYYGRTECAIKLLNNVDYPSLIHEIPILSNISHKNIPKFYGFINENNTFGIVMEYIKGKTLERINYQDISDNLKYKIIKEIANVLEYLHINNIIHRDLKLENIMVDEFQNVFLIDFDISKILYNKNNILTKTKGTLNYLAPECLEPKALTENEEIINLITNKVDVWAYGCIVSYILSGEKPWEHELNKGESLYYQYKELINNKEFPIPSSIEQSNKFYEIIRLCTVIDPNHRISIEDVNDILFELFNDSPDQAKINCTNNIK